MPVEINRNTIKYCRQVDAGRFVLLLRKTAIAVAQLVVIVDDDMDDLEIIQDAIKAYDPTVVCRCFLDPEEAISFFLSQSSALPDYVFTDINMPRIDGRQLLLKLRDHLKLSGIIVSMLSTSMTDTMAAHLRSEGADFAFPKPIRFEDYQSLFRIVFAEKAERKRQSNRNRDLNNEMKCFRDLELGKLMREQMSIYIIDYSWNYLFANTFAIEKMNGYDIVGKNITLVWKDLPQFNFQPVFHQLKDSVDNRVPLELTQTSPITHSTVKITGTPMSDCYLFSIAQHN